MFVTRVGEVVGWSARAVQALRFHSAWWSRDAFTFRGARQHLFSQLPVRRASSLRIAALWSVHHHADLFLVDARLAPNEFYPILRIIVRQSGKVEVSRRGEEAENVLGSLCGISLTCDSGKLG